MLKQYYNTTGQKIKEELILIPIDVTIVFWYNKYIMDIGIVREKRARGLDVRVALLPPEVRRLVNKGHRVFVEKNAGRKIFIYDGEYKKAGAIIKESPEVYNKDIVVKLKFPPPKELAMMKNDNIVFCMVHGQQSPINIDMLRKYKLRAIAMEQIVNPAGERLINCTRMSGEQAMILAFKEVLKSPRDCNILCLGYGEIATGALSVAFSLGAQVKILRKCEYRFIKHHLKNKDMVINGICWPKEYRDKKVHLITKDMLKLLNPGGVILDLSVDFPGPIETTRPTQLDKPSYVVDGITHICIYGYPGLSPISSSRRYSKQILPILLEIANKGLTRLPSYIKKAVIIP